MSQGDNDLDDFGTALLDVTQPQDSRGVLASHHSPSESEIRQTTYVQWASHGSRGYSAAGLSVPRLPSQVYGFDWRGETLLFVSKPQEIDELYEFEDGDGARFLDEVDAFYRSAERYAAYKFKHRRGFLLYGPAGGGKTTLVQQAIQRVLRLDGLVLLANNHPNTLKYGLEQIRIIEPQRHVMCVFEDIDALIMQYGESELLSLLDGEAQVDRCLNLATTNYPERLDKRIVARPRRFDRRYKIGFPNPKVRRAYLSKKLFDAADATLIDELVAASEGMSLAALADLVISIKCLNLDKEQALHDIRRMLTVMPSSDERGDVGFGGR